MQGRKDMFQIMADHRRMTALSIVFAMLCCLMPISALASYAPSEFLCGHTHDEDCGYVDASPCTDVHVHDENCGYCEGAPGTYTNIHDECCGYSEPVLSAPCGHICEILSFNDFTAGEAVSTYEAEAGEAYEDICAALPEALPGTLACTDGDVDIPVCWSCANFSTEPGTYTFGAELENEHCAYAVIDDALTEDVDESELPFITVTVPEPTPEPAISLTSGAVTVSGVLPEGAHLVVDEVAVETAQKLLGETETVILFAYDIKIMLPGVLDEATGEYGEPTEYQPTAENPVTVTITPPKPIAAPTVEVLHIAEDESGETIPQPVEDVTTTKTSVEFAAEAFSVYVVTMGTDTPRVTFSYDNTRFNVEYCTTSNGTYELFNSSDEVAVTAGTALYFKVTGGSFKVYRDGSTTPMTAGADSVYTVDNITANTIITITNDVGSNVTLNVGNGPIVIGKNDESGGRKYTYYEDGIQKIGTHVPGNIYTIRGTTGTQADGGGNNVSLTGEGDFNIILDNVSICTGTPGPNGVGQCAPVSTHDVEGDGNIIITLVGTSTLQNVSGNASDSYAALEKSDNSSTLIINGNGTLRAIGGADSAGIGSSDCLHKGTKNITINSGTIYATTIDSQGAGIGSGDNKEAENIRIYGGDITAIGVNNGAGIGGSGSVNYTATRGQVYIYGGTIKATSNGKGAGIGGGGSGDDNQAEGGGGEVHIYGGTITADSIGGGDGGRLGGAATVNISGGTIKATSNGKGASIGGGNSTKGSGGAATIAISGGTITAANISGGHGVGGAHAGGTLTVTGGSAKVEHVCPAITTTGIGGSTPLTYNVYVANGGQAVRNMEVTAIDIDPSVDYGLNDVYTDNDGCLYLWLPSGTTVNSVTVNINGSSTPCSTTQFQAAASITPAPTNGNINYTETLTAHLSGDATASTYIWQKFSNSVWNEIGTGSTYTPTISDVGSEIRVKINNTYTSPSVFIGVPQLSITVPTTMVVTVDASGECTVSGGSIYNSFNGLRYVTGVTFAWQTEGANELFYDYTRITAKLTMNGAEYSFSGVTPTAVVPSAEAGKINAQVSAIPGTLPLNWTFTLGEGNHLKLAPAMGAAVHVATVTYTVGDTPPTTP